MNSVNSGVEYCEDLIYCAGQKGIQMINLNDVNITKTEGTDLSYVTTFRDNIFYIDCNDHSVTCIDFQGNIQWVFKNKSDFHAPFGISVDVDRIVYVAGKKSNNVVVISFNGQNFRQLLTNENGLRGSVVVDQVVRCL